MAGNARQVINMANSIVGVSILSMPFCFKESGLLLGVILVLVTGFITKKTCMFLIRSAIMARRRSYEFLAFHVFGVSGKLFVEMCMILFLFGICISFYVVMGDLAPAMVARFMSIENSSSLRYTLLIGIAVLVILPLCLLRNLDHLASMSAFSIMFYFFLIVVIFWHAFPKLWDGTWIHTAELWRPAGALQVLPILSLALACQSNVFEIYDSVPDPDVPKMRFVVNHAVNLCSALYISVGFLGYVAFVDKDFGGNIIMSFPDSGLTEGIKMFFAVSLAISFPLMIFPCRTSIHSLIYRRSNPSSFDLVGNYMPESRFKAITLGILFSSLVIGIMIPSIELVLGLLGSTMGMLIATILPSLLFIKVNTKASTERLLAQGIMLMGIMLIVTGTYLNLAHIREVQELPLSPTELIKTNMEPQMPKIMDAGEGVKEGKAVPAAAVEDTATRKEPVAPEPPPEENGSLQKDKEESDGKDKEKAPNEVKLNGNIKDNSGTNDNKEINEENINNNKNEGDILHPDAIQKEEKENEEEKDKVQEGKDIEKKQAEILEKMEVQHQEQQQILEEQKKILKELKDHKLKQEEEEAKKQEESKAKNAGAGNVLAEQDSQKLDVNNLGLQAGIPIGVESLDNRLKPSLNQNHLLSNAQPIHYAGSNIYTVDNGLKAVELNARALDVDKKEVSLAEGKPLGQNKKDGKILIAASIPTVGQSILSSVNNNQVVDPNMKMNPQLPMAYYHVNSPSLVQNAPILNYVNNLPPGPAENIAAQPASNFHGKPASPLDGMLVQNAPVNEPLQPLQPLQLRGQGLPAHAVMQEHPVQAVMPEHPAQAVMPDHPAQAVMPEHPAQAVMPEHPAQAVMPEHPAQAAIQGYPQQLVVQNQPAKAAMQRQLPQAVMQGHLAPAAAQGQFLQAALPDQYAQAAVQSHPRQADTPGQLHQPAVQVVKEAEMGHVAQALGPGQAGQAIVLDQPPGASQGNYLELGQPPQDKVHSPSLQENMPVHLSQSNFVGRPVPIETQPSIVGQAFAGSIIANQPPVGTNSQGLPVVEPAPLSNFEDKSKLDVGGLQSNPKTEDKRLNEIEKQMKESVSKNNKGKLSKITEDSKSNSVKKEEKVDSVKKGQRAKENIVKGNISGRDKSMKKTQHDEERRKREVDGYLFDLPHGDILKELKWKEFGDVVYDTRHLLWTGRSRRKKRNKGRDEDYYWDET